MPVRTLTLALVVALLLPAVVFAQDRPAGKTLVVGDPSADAVLPPALPWKGQSRSVAVAADHSWATPFEKSDFRDSPSYEETVGWLRRLADAAPEVEMVSLGTSPEGRDIVMMVVSAEGSFTAEAVRKSQRPAILVQGGIHAGEIDGKDAGMMLLRDLTVRGNKKELLSGANVLFVPILNVDGHERSSPFNRINQRGPETMGWRTNSKNLNLNRDFAKLDTPEVRYLVRALTEWRPALYIDVHVTDGVDYQYDITWGNNGPHAWSPNAAAWFDAYFTPVVTRELRAAGHVPGPLVSAVNNRDLTEGNLAFTAGPRYSNGYGDAAHLPSVLVENHSLKPFDQRVFGTYLFLESALRVVGRNGRELKRAAATDGKTRRKDIPLGFQALPGPSAQVEFLGVESRLLPSAVSGGFFVEWTGTPRTQTIGYPQMTQPSAVVARPKAYWIPPAYSEVIDRLELHGVRVERISQPRALPVTMYRIADPKLAETPFEGRMRVEGTPIPEKRTERFASGSVRVPTDQPLGNLVALLLEPAGPDSFFRWGFFLEVLQQAEYVEPYVMEPLAERMLRENPHLAGEFIAKLEEEPDFAGNPTARLQWFYERTPYFDERWRLYPVARED